MRDMPEIEWSVEPSCNDWKGYYFTISADDRDNILNWMVEAKAENKRLRESFEQEVIRLLNVNKQLEVENERLKELCERWEHMIDPNINPGGCANCFHQEFLKALMF